MEYKLPVILWQLLRKNRMKQRDLAKTLFVTQAAVSAWMCERTTPQITEIIKMSELFNVSLDYLICGKEDKETKEGNT